MIRDRVLVAVTGGGILLASGWLVGQEVGGDVTIPPPWEMVSSAGVARPLGVQIGPTTVTQFRATVSAVLTGVREGTLTEREARERLGDVIVSLLVKRRSLVFEVGGG